MYILSIWGEEVINKFEGKHSIFFDDRAEENITIARDKLEIRPLNYFIDNKVLVFLSEVNQYLQTL